MEKLHASWKKTPTHIRRPFVLIIGLLIILCSGLIGWLPGPGGIPVFLLGIAILATEFAWADRLKVAILSRIHRFSSWAQHAPLRATFVVIISLVCSLTIAYMLFITK